MEHGVVVRPETAQPESEKFLYGLIAEFEQPEELVTAAPRTREAGYRQIDAYSPFPVEELSDALGFHDFAVPIIMLCGGIFGALGGFGLLYYCMVISYPLNIGGQPLSGWPIMVPITFECTVLLAAFAGVLAMFLLNRLPEPYHPVFDAPNFDKATSSRFFLCIESRDPNFDRAGTRQFMETFGAARVSEVELKK
jgi:hypothetical protein